MSCHKLHLNKKRSPVNSIGNDTPALQGTSYSIFKLLADAFGRHKAGQLHKAELLYQRVLQLDPNNAVALHMLGVLALQSGRNTLAEELIVKAIAQNDNVPAFHCNLVPCVN
jgi:Flp pilus assembly protein TadD